MNKVIPLLAFSILLLVPVGTQNAFATTLLIEDFEDGSITYSTNVPEFTDGVIDYFLRTGGSNISPSVNFNGIQGTSFFAAQDIDGIGAIEDKILFFNPITISGCQDLEFSGLFAEDDDGPTENWDAFSDFVAVQYRIDGDFIKTFLIFSGNSGANSAPAEDTDFDGMGDGTILTDSFTQFTKSISDSGDTLELFIRLRLDSSQEDIAFDNITILCNDDDNGNGNEESQVIGGEIIPIESTSLILAGTQSFSWMIPVLLSGIGIGLFIFRKSKNS